MKIYKIVFTRNPIDEYWDTIIWTRRVRWECFDPSEYWESNTIRVTEDQLASMLYDLIDSGRSFELKTV